MARIDEHAPLRRYDHGGNDQKKTAALGPVLSYAARERGASRPALGQRRALALSPCGLVVTTRHFNGECGQVAGQQVGIGMNERFEYAQRERLGSVDDGRSRRIPPAADAPGPFAVKTG